MPAFFFCGLLPKNAFAGRAGPGHSPSYYRASDEPADHPRDEGHSILVTGLGNVENCSDPQNKNRENSCTEKCPDENHKEVVLRRFFKTAAATKARSARKYAPANVPTANKKAFSFVACGRETHANRNLPNDRQYPEYQNENEKVRERDN